MKKIRVGIEILEYLSGQHEPKNVKEITNFINQRYELKEPIKERSALEYLRELSKEFAIREGGISIQSIESIKGVNGGWKITDEGRRRMGKISLTKFNKDELNAINDAFQRAFISETFHYKKDLEKAKDILYAKKDFFESDHEHYIGNKKELVDNLTLKKIKKAAVENKYITLEMKHIRYGVTKEVMTLKPLRLIHDLDESFLVCSTKNNFEPFYINLRNIKQAIPTEQKFCRKGETKFKQNLNNNKSSIKPRIEQWATIEVLDNRVHEVIDLWVNGCSYEYSNNNKTIFVKSSEHYKLMIFLFRIIGHAKILDAHPDIIKRWNKKVDNIIKIKE